MEKHGLSFYLATGGSQGNQSLSLLVQIRPLCSPFHKTPYPILKYYFHSIALVGLLLMVRNMIFIPQLNLFLAQLHPVFLR